jgi:hypothetical protein
MMTDWWRDFYKGKPDWWDAMLHRNTSRLRDIVETGINDDVQYLVLSNNEMRISRGRRWATYDFQGKLISHGYSGLEAPYKWDVENWGKEVAGLVQQMQVLPADFDALYVRFGKPPISGCSKNHFSGKIEKGLSVYKAFLNPKVNLIMIWGTQPGAMIAYLNRGVQAYLLTGRIVGEGSDEEPLLRPFEILGELELDNSRGGFIFSPLKNEIPKKDG